MEFTKLTKTPQEFLSLRECVVWVNEDESCTIVMYSQYPRVDHHLAHRTIRIYMGRPHRTDTHNVALCRKDGVAAFVVREIMAIASEYGCDGHALTSKSAVYNFIESMPFVAALSDFHRYKNGQGRIS